ncbi:ABC transporter ATP-binding protein [Paenibacillus wynnii]|uniref:ABC transporter ATP-binding protein n=1 Tax=Paenibacillus wynnii TaxID=268407 RepID=UPI0027903AEB|nr:ABC transporter ATP-binding protein [Paenibacillus wynnii]MDQ0195589.1 putative hydroxymethylpyrimidine transport system ATP-binding protein [Paenibacillus wynnii]
MSTNTMISINDLSYSFDPQQKYPVLSGLSMNVKHGEFVSVIGASGCGKSTLFKIIAGLSEPTSGDIIWQDATSSANTRLGNIAYMPQQDLLLPWRSVLDNCLLPWEVTQNRSKAETISLIREMLERFGLAEVEQAYPNELSGGMRQRIAFLRTLVTGADLMLLDEPFGALDAITKREMHKWLTGLWDGLAKTVLFITHDLEEAILLSDRIYLMSGSQSKAPMQEFIVDLPRPRHSAMNYDPRFLKLREDLEKRLYDTHSS